MLVRAYMQIRISPGHLEKQADIFIIYLGGLSDYCPESHIKSDGGFFQNGGLKEYSSLQENPYHVRYIHNVLIIHIYFAPQAVDNI